MSEARPRPAALAWAFALAAGTAAAFAPILRNGFVNWDDGDNIVRNGRLGQLDPAGIKWAFTTPLGGHFQPLAWLSLSLDKRLWGLNSAGFHLTSLLLHAAAAVALFFLLRELLGSGRDADFPAAAAAALFAWHPMRVESVAWATERRDQLSLLFLILSAWAYRRAVARDSRRPNLDAAVLFFFGALLSKVFAAIFPGLLIALDLGVLRRRETLRRLLEEKWAFILAALAALALGVRAQLLSGAAPGLAAAGWGERLAVLAWTPGWTLWKTVLPTGLGPFVSVDWASEPWRFWPMAALSALLASGLIVFRRKPARFWLLAAWFLALSPALGLFKSGWQSSADRYSLIPDAVLAVGAAFLLRRASRPARAVAAAACLLLGAMTFAQTGVWKDSISLWTRALATGSKSAQAYSGLSDALYEAGRSGEARALAERLNAGSDQALVLMADARYAAGDFAGAADFMKKAVERAPKSPQLRLKYASALYLAVRPREAAEQDALAVELFPEGDVGKAEAEYSLGAVQLALGQAKEAEESLSRALRLDPTRRDARELLDKLRARMRGAPKR